MPEFGKGTAAKEVKEEIRGIDRSQLDDRGNAALDEASRKAEEFEALVGSIGNEAMNDLMNTEIDDEALDAFADAIKKAREESNASGGEQGEPQKEDAPKESNVQEPNKDDEFAGNEEVGDEGGINAIPDGRASKSDLQPSVEGEDSEIIYNDDAMSFESQIKDLSNPFPDREPNPVPAGPQQAGKDLLQAGRGQKAVEGKQFKAVKTEYKTIGVGGWTARVLGHALFGVFTALQTAYYAVKNGIKSAHRKRIRWKEEKKLTEEEREQRAEEARNAAERAKEPTELDRINEGAEDQEISTNYSKKPLFWEKNIAEDPDQAPYVSVDISKEEGKEQSLADSMGHASLALNYTRFDRITGRRERCRVKMGFYVGGGMGSGSTGVTMLGKGAFIGGQLKDDSNASTTMGKRYAANNRQINHILAESGAYESGGYHSLKRNCATFVADVTQHAGIPTGDILKETDLNLGIGWVIVPLIPVLAPLFDFSTGKAIDRANTKMNRDFSKEGEKLLSDELRQKHYDASDNTMRWSLQSPTAAGERIRRSRGGILHASGYAVHDEEGSEITDFSSRMWVASQTLEDAIQKVTQNTVRKNGESFEAAIVELETKIQSAVPPIAEKQKRISSRLELNLKANEVNDLCRQCVTELQALQEYISNWYYTVVDGDERLNDAFLRFVSVLEDGQSELNDIYDYHSVRNQTENRRDVAGLLQSFRMGEALTYRKSIWSQDGLTRQEGHIDKLDVFTGEEIISAIKTYGSLQAALDAWDRLRVIEAHSERFRSRRLNFQDAKEEQRVLKEQEKLKQQEKFRENYREDARGSIKGDLSRTSMTEEDVRFAFVTLPKEFEDKKMDRRKSGVALYQALIYEKVFGGLRIKAEQAYKDAGGDSGIFFEEISAFLYERVGEKPDEMNLIVSVQDEKNDGLSAQERYMGFLENFFDVYLSEALRLALGDLLEPAAVGAWLKQYRDELSGTAMLESEGSRWFREELLRQFGRHIA